VFRRPAHKTCPGNFFLYDRIIYFHNGFMSLSLLLANALKLLIIAGPPSAIPILLSLTPGYGPRERMKVAIIACSFAATLLVILALTGPAVFHFFGISLQAFKIGGGVYLVLISFSIMVELKGAAADGAGEKREEMAPPSSPMDVAITPLGLPIICGPGMISTTLLFGTDLPSWGGKLNLIGSVTLSLFVLFVMLALAVKYAEKISPFALKLAGRLTGIFIAALGFLIFWGGVQTFLEQGSIF
jgi:multiple antibiotic resistance protein